MVGGFTIGIFLLSMLFYTQMHPIVISDTDDFAFTYYHRVALPLWENWNPIRVFPEVFMPLVSRIGTYFIMPFTNDYFYALTCSYALAVSLTISVVFFSLFRYLKRLRVNGYKSIILVLFFVVCHFWIFRITPEGNSYMLGTIDACTYFFYVIPNLLNCSVVLLISSQSETGSFFAKLDLKKAFYITVIYFCIFSNLFASIILISYLVTDIMANIIMFKRKHLNFIEFIRKHDFKITVIIIWLVSQLFEFNGGRATAIRTRSYTESIKKVLKTAKDVLLRLNSGFVFAILMIMIIGVALTILKRQWDLLKRLLFAGSSTLIVGTYIILICVVAGNQYLERTDVFYGCFFYGMIFILLCLYQIMRCIPFIQLLMPLLLTIISTECNTEGKTFCEANIQQLPPQLWIDIDNDIMNQFLEAQENGEKEIVLYVPLFNEEGNWPLSVDATNTFSNHFYKMGITDYRIDVIEVIPSKEKNAKLNINKF